MGASGVLLLVPLLVAAASGRQQGALELRLGPVDETIANYEGMNAAEKTNVVASAAGMVVSFMEEYAYLVDDVFPMCVYANATATNASLGCDVNQAMHAVFNAAAKSFEDRYYVRLSADPTIHPENKASSPITENDLPVLLQLDAEKSAKYTDYVVMQSKMLSGTNQERPATFYEMTALLTWAVSWGIDLATPEMTPFYQSMKDLGLIPTPLKRKIKAPCTDKDLDAKDRDDHHCSWYTENLERCGMLDTDTFVADEMCCDCKTSFSPLDERPKLKLITDKWRLLHDVYPSFETWKSIWAPNTPRDSTADANEICRDWLPMVHRFYKKEAPSREWRCDHNPGSRMMDVDNIFTVSGIPLSMTTKSFTPKDHEAKIANVRKSMDTAFGLPAICNKDPESVDCSEARKKQDKMIESVLEKEHSLQSFDVSHVRDSIFAIWTKRDEIFDYFCETGPALRLHQLFDLPEGRGDTSQDDAARYYTLPDDDLHMCWQIMETALVTEVSSSMHAYDLIRSVIKAFISLAGEDRAHLGIGFTRVAMTYYHHLLYTSRFTNTCPSTGTLFDPATFQTLQCTNGNYVGSTCFGICKIDTGESADGVTRTLYTYCTKSGLWENPQFRYSCSTQIDDVDATGTPNRIYA